MAGTLKIQHGGTASTPESGYSTLWVNNSGIPYFAKSDGSQERLVTDNIPSDPFNSIPDISQFITLTQEEYDSLSSPEENTVYVVMDVRFNANPSATTLNGGLSYLPDATVNGGQAVKIQVTDGVITSVVEFTGQGNYEDPSTGFYFIGPDTALGNGVATIMQNQFDVDGLDVTVTPVGADFQGIKIQSLSGRELIITTIVLGNLFGQILPFANEPNTGSNSMMSLPSTITGYDWSGGEQPIFSYTTNAYLGAVKIFSTTVNV